MTRSRPISNINLLLLKKPLLFTMCFLDERIVIEEISIIYYVLSHSISRFSLKTRMSSIFSYWENLYYLLCASSMSALSLRKPLSFTMCFLILFLDFLWKHAWAQSSLTEKISIIYYVLSRRAHCHWRTLYYFVCAFSSCSSTSALSLRKSLLFSECFLSYRCSRLDIDSDRDRCQVISRDIEKISII